MRMDYDSLARKYPKHPQVQPESTKELIRIGRRNSASLLLDVRCSGIHIGILAASTVHGQDARSNHYQFTELAGNV